MDKKELTKAEKLKIWRTNNKERVKAHNAKNKERNGEKIKLINAKYRETNKEKISEYFKDYSTKNKQKIAEQGKIYREKNKESLRLKREMSKEAQKKYYAQNREKINAQRRINHQKRKSSDPLYHLRSNISRLISNTIKKNGYSKKSKTANILGCTFEEFKAHLESKFESWMTWENYGLYNGTENYGWDIDHIIPVSLAENEERLVQLNHHTNLQPLCSKYNRHIKSNNIIS